MALGSLPTCLPGLSYPQAKRISHTLSITHPSPTQIEASLCKSSLKHFIHKSWHLVEPSVPLKWNWHHDLIVYELECLARGLNKRLIINIPPGFSKSMFVSVMFNAWVWTFDPSARFLTFSYSKDNTLRDNGRVRDIITSDWYQRTFWSNPSITLSEEDDKGNVKVSKNHTGKVKLASDQNAKVKFVTSSKGWRIASSVEGMATGEHPNYLIIDDAAKAQEAHSESAQDRVTNWFDETVSTRKALDPVIVNVMQRLGLRDLTAHIEKKFPGAWRKLVLPMRFEPANEKEDYYPDERDPRTEPGELLFPEVWTEEMVQEEELSLGPIGSAGQLQQMPVSREGLRFKRSLIEIVPVLPSDCIFTRGWDTADTPEKKAKGDWTCGYKLAYSFQTGKFIICHAIRERSESLSVNELILNTAKSDGKKVHISEGSGSGKAITAARSIWLKGYDYQVMPETEDKIMRAGAFESQLNAGNVQMLEGDWNERSLDEICSFPTGKHDDDVDSIVHAFNRLVELAERHPGSGRLVIPRKNPRDVYGAGYGQAGAGSG